MRKEGRKEEEWVGDKIRKGEKRENERRKERTGMEEGRKGKEKVENKVRKGEKRESERGKVKNSQNERVGE